MAVEWAMRITACDVIGVIACMHNRGACRNLQKVHEMKLNREKLIREELGESEPNSTLNSALLVDHEHTTTVANGVGVHSPVGNGHAVVVSNGDVAHKNGSANGDVKVPCIVLSAPESPTSEDVSAVTPQDEITPLRAPIYRPPRSHSMGKRSELQVLLLQKKLEQTAAGQVAAAHGDADDVRTLTSAPSLAHNGVGPRHASLPVKPDQFHSDILAKAKAQHAQKRTSLKVDGHDAQDYSRPMYRKDIFYSGSVYNVAEYQQSHQDVTTYIRSMTSIPDEVEPAKQRALWRVCGRCCPKVITDVFKQMLDVSIFRDPVFIIACLANMVGFLGIFVPFVFIADRAMSFGVEKGQAALLLSVIGESWRHVTC